MITTNASSPDVLLPAIATINPNPTPAPTAKSGDTQHQESFAKLMGDTMGDQGQPSTASTASPTKATKDDKKDKDKDKGSEKTVAPTVLPTMVMSVPVPPSPVPTITKTSTTEGKASAVTSAPLPVVQAPNVAVDAKKDAIVATVVPPMTDVPVDSKPVASAIPKPVSKEAGEIKTSAQGEDKSTEAVAAKPISVDLSNGGSSAHHEDHRPPQQSNPAPQAVSTSASTPAGTGTAKQVATMKPQEKVEGNVRTAEKNLPHGNFLPDNGRSESSEASPRSVIVPETRATQVSSTSSTAVSVSPIVGGDRAVSIGTHASVDMVRSPQVDKALTEVSDSAISFKRIGAESVDVNLQPDRGTEINLHLSLNNGQVEVAARLERGNFDSLNTHWSGLQQSLAQQGIRVGQLEHSSLNQNLEGNQNRNQAAFTQTMQQELGGQRQPSSDRASEVSDEPAHAGTSATPQRTSDNRGTNPTRRGWEMWA